MKWLISREFWRKLSKTSNLLNFFLSLSFSSDSCVFHAVQSNDHSCFFQSSVLYLHSYKNLMFFLFILFFSFLQFKKTLICLFQRDIYYKKCSLRIKILQNSFNYPTSSRNLHICASNCKVVHRESGWPQQRENNKGPRHWMSEFWSARGAEITSWAAAHALLHSKCTHVSLHPYPTPLPFATTALPYGYV